MNKPIKNKFNYKRLNVGIFKKTHDDWYGSYILSMKPHHLDDKNKLSIDPRFPDNMIYIFLKDISIPVDQKSIYRIGVWGTDDLGMDRDFYDENEAREIFYKIIELEFVDKDILEKVFGFKYF